ncbi:MAG TPA: hypothetical protein VFQ39_03850 [Longimicrobium sp.]|nr:hypothetical protein [Longimicrobium sp.]
MRRFRPRAILLSWALVWFGAILCANPRPPLRTLGAVLWGGGVAIQLAVGGGWLADRGSRGGRIPLST